MSLGVEAGLQFGHIIFCLNSWVWTSKYVKGYKSPLSSITLFPLNGYAYTVRSGIEKLKLNVNSNLLIFEKWASADRAGQMIRWPAI